MVDLGCAFGGGVGGTSPVPPIPEPVPVALPNWEDIHDPALDAALPTANPTFCAALNNAWVAEGLVCIDEPAERGCGPEFGGGGYCCFADEPEPEPRPEGEEDKGTGRRLDKLSESEGGGAGVESCPSLRRPWSMRICSNCSWRLDNIEDSSLTSSGNVIFTYLYKKTPKE